MAGQNEVMVAFEILLKEIEAVVEKLKREGAGELNRGNYRVAKEMIDHAERVAAFREKIMELKVEWQKSFSQEVDETAPNREPTGASPRRPKLERGLNTTPRESYRRPILEALVELGGSARAYEVAERVYEKTKDRLTVADKQRLNSGEERWRKNTMWCRYEMKNEGLLADNSPRGIWEITPAGRLELARLKKEKVYCNFNC
ncbi:hypothetical protein PTH_0862 [Pelotomaculum thermopropionicum SI]|uniref:Restriction system protein Mrr-like N-terminal domain-containing protein n=1 Tax=Pelotomaculum thermopropionicum (strain DSM 13744 / JCM 10971 / SI) TaxID=370438 RepID=A5D400_PELTS|nr:hypothetical protein PTH_0862 [Pelotomaculum thermopropionicum SI]